MTKSVDKIVRRTMGTDGQAGRRAEILFGSGSHHPDCHPRWSTHAAHRPTIAQQLCACACAGGREVGDGVGEYGCACMSLRGIVAAEVVGIEAAKRALRSDDLRTRLTPLNRRQAPADAQPKHQQRPHISEHTPHLFNSLSAPNLRRTDKYTIFFKNNRYRPKKWSVENKS